MKRNYFRKMIFVTVPAAVILTIYAAWSSHVSGSENALSSSNPVVKIVTVERSHGEERLEISGFVRGTERANIAPMASGRIMKVYKREGETVRKGETIAVIDADQANAQVNAANENIAALKKTLDETDDYYDQLVDETKKSKDKEAIKSAKRARDLQKQIVESQIVAVEGTANIARVGKNDSILMAPFSGTITSMPVHEGDFAVIGVPLASVDSSDSFELETYVSAEDGRKVSVGNIVDIRSIDGTSVSGSVISVSPAVDTQNLKTLVRIHIDEPAGSVKLGDFVRGSIKISDVGQSQIYIPRKAIISRGGDQAVFVVDDKNIATERVLKLDKEQDGNVTVIEGISEGEKLVVEGQHNLVNNMTVKLYAEK